MRKRTCLKWTSPAVLIGFGVVMAVSATAQTPAPSAPQAAPASPAPPQKDYRPGLGDLMLLIVQPRHLKLGLAGREGNWPLAQFNLNEMKNALSKAGLHQPRWRNGFPIPETTNATMSGPVEALEIAIKAKDAAGFGRAYAEATAGCNACHAAANIGFIAIKVPDQAGFANQDFGVPKK